jgi:hypothetical protein
MGKSKMTRRGLLASGAAMAGAATAGAAARGAGSATEEAPPESVELAVVEGVSDEGVLTLKKEDGTVEEVRDPRPDEEWRPSHEAAVVRHFIEGSWVLVNVQRLYRPILDLEIVDRDGALLETSGSDLRLGSESSPREGPDFEARPLREIEPGNVVSGIGHLEPTADALAIDQIGVRER